MGMLVISAETVIGLRNGPEMAQLSKNPPEIYAQLSPFTLCIFTKKVSIHGLFLPRCVNRPLVRHRGQAPCETEWEWSTKCAKVAEVKPTTPLLS